MNSTTLDLADLIDRAASGWEIITLESGNQKKSVLMGAEIFKYLVSLNRYRRSETMPGDEFEKEFHQALVGASYDFRGKILSLVREVKELCEERC